MTDLTALGAAEAARRIAAGALTAEALMRALLERIAAREPTVRAWAYLDPEHALAQARARDAERPIGRLHGVPIAVKDVIATEDQPTECNSPIYRGHVPARDADCVRRLRQAGAVIMGKTVTTEFAFMRPGPTTHPRDPTRTPGGSSSGSAAAVADFMAPVALGTQTGGSTIRPAAFCGVVGYKPGFGRFDLQGVKLLAPSLDTIGVIARSVEDVALVAAVIAGSAVAPLAPEPPRLAVLLPYREQAEDQALAALERAMRAASARGAVVRSLESPGEFGGLNDAHRVIMAAQTARAFAWEWARHRDALSPELRDFIARGQSYSAAEQDAAWALVDRCRAWLSANLAQGEIIATLGAPGEAPVGLAATGNAIFNRLWSLLQSACLTVPMGEGAHRLPLGLQLVAHDGAEQSLLQAGDWLMRCLHGGHV
jgi:Asp-tRNA(Asn)/Glu-tRNA(Gln) amidotransferase A subunit family amidase